MAKLKNSWYDLMEALEAEREMDPRFIDETSEAEATLAAVYFGTAKLAYTTSCDHPEVTDEIQKMESVGMIPLTQIGCIRAQAFKDKKGKLYFQISSIGNDIIYTELKNVTTK